MRIVSAALAAAVVLGWGAGASAQGTDLVQDLCVSTNAQMKPALAKADAAGWMAISKAAAPIPPSANFALDDYAVRVKPDGKGVQVLIVGFGTTHSASAAMPADICLVVSQPGDVAAVDRFKAWLGVEPVITQAQQGMALYMFEETPDGRKALVANDAGKAATLAGRMRMGLTMVQPTANGATMLGYVIIRSAGQAGGAKP
jgi:hypothetical protein